MAGRLGDILVDRGLLTQEQLEEALQMQRATRTMLGDILLERGWIDKTQVGQALAQQFEVPFHAIDPHAINPQIVRLLPEPFARSRTVLPIEVAGGCMKLCMVAPDDIEAISETELISGYRVDPVVSIADEVDAALDQGFDDRTVARQTIVDMKLAELEDGEELPEDSAGSGLDEEEDAPVIRLVKAILAGSISAGASDVHLEPHAPEMRVRYRVDGELQQIMTIPGHIEEAVIARIKVMADMDTTETRRPQDGHISVVEDGTKVNFRVSAIPCVGGEKMVLRLLDEGNKVFSLEQLGLSVDNLQTIQTMIDKPHGMIVVTGPTGSGKSTTMYAMLTELNQVHRNIVTVEDPVEYRLTGINQVHSDNEFGMGFVNALKFIMRQDPDVIMVGEIRDCETATVAVQAALTGHLLISTLHTNDAIGAVPRLNDLGVDQFKIGGSLLGSVAQRLLRTICPECKQQVQPNGALLKAIAPDAEIPADAQFFQGRGCKACLGTGFSGRMPIFEVMPVTPELASAIEAGSPATKLREIAIHHGMQELSGSGLEAAFAGKTTVEEVYYKTSN